MKTLLDREILSIEDTIIPVALELGRPEEPLTTAIAIKVLVRQTPLRRMVDVEHGVRIVEVVRSANGVIPLEEAEYAWLMNQLEETGPAVFRLNALQVKAALQDFAPEIRESPDTSKG